ncbi:hypothetical protein [Myxococcus virescens]|uniref:Secreted protein n=1 Tax=Myxococcus virescens TaxID=83456 RepID=A0A511HL55_9BACT|nr:hypothetical protein [Myxococcus virescens]GEL74311.1 hypothetical protein MVI01_60950 [Myxococcus virescens]SDD45221.1 hypothetical protein SAMN04488504_101936 [Myxococcus virescens]
MKRLSLKSSFAVASCVSGIAALAFTVAPAAAFAQVPPPEFTLVECMQGSQSQNYTPAISLFARLVDVTGSGQFSSCLDATDPGIALGSFTITGNGAASCLMASVPTQNTVTWNDGSQSVIEFLGGVDVRPVGMTMVTLLGRVSSGRYENALAIKTMDVSSVPGVTQCILGGVSSATANVSLTLLRLF